MDALRLVHAQQGTAIWASPFGNFFRHEVFDSGSLDLLQIGNGADAIPGAVTILKMAQDSTRIAGTGKTEPEFAGR